MFLEAVRHPILTGAIAATTRRCTEMFLDSANLNGERRIVELGGGSGAVTEPLRERLPADGRLWAVELNPALARQLRRRFAHQDVEVIDGSALDLPELLAEREVDTVDRVLCTMPITPMSAADQRQLVHSAYKVLDKGGELNIMLFAHSTHTGVWRRFEKILSEYFEEIEPGPTFWMNPPPMRAYHCRSPVPASL